MREFDAVVRRLSNAGVTFAVSSDSHAELGSHSDVMVSLTLPGRRQLYSIACIVRNRAAVDNQILYGCEFDWSATMDPLGVVEDILEYTLDA